MTTKEEQLLESKKKRKFDIREEYFVRIAFASSPPADRPMQRLQAQEDNSDWEPKRIERPKDVPEWGVAPEAPRQLPEGGFTERDAKRRQSAKARRENTPSDSSKP